MNIDALPTLEEDLQTLGKHLAPGSPVLANADARAATRSYQLGFIILFSLIVVLALAIILGFAGIPDGKLTESANTHEPDVAVELADLLEENKDNEYDTA